MASGYGLAGGTYNLLSGGYFRGFWRAAETPRQSQWHLEERIWNGCEERLRRLHDATTYAEFTDTFGLYRSDKKGWDWVALSVRRRAAAIQRQQYFQYDKSARTRRTTRRICRTDTLNSQGITPRLRRPYTSLIASVSRPPASFPRFRRSIRTCRSRPELSNPSLHISKLGAGANMLPRPIPLLPLLARSPSMLHHQHKRRGRLRQSKMRTRP
jgi:hypothetical protein